MDLRDPILPGDTGTRPAKAKAASPAMAPGSRSTVENALALVAALSRTTTTRPSTGSSADAASGPVVHLVPSAGVYAALGELALPGSAEALQAARVDLRAVVRDLVGWHDERLATKALVRAAGRALLSRDAAGRSCYPQAVEALSYVAACAPLLDADRLAALLDEVPLTANAYAPMRFPLQTAATLETYLSRYAPARRAKLLVSLWHAAHDGRWWTVTGGVHTPTQRRRGRKLRQAAEARIEQLGDTASDAELFICQLEAGTAHFDDAAAAHAAVADCDPMQLARARRLAQMTPPPDPDIPVLLSYLPGLAPLERPSSPVAELVAALDRTVIALDPAELAALEQSSFWTKPGSWGEMYPLASLLPFPFPRGFLDTDGPMPGLPAAHLRWVRTPHGLSLNASREEMGNCTFSYCSRAERGEWFVAYIVYNGERYNAAVSRNGAGWAVTEIKGRFNAANVPAELTAAFTTLAAALPR
jgi:hypothetical protein